MRPKVLILDEPTASLDRDSTELLFDRIRAVARTGTSVIYITHRLAEVRQIAQRVTVLRDGRVRGVALVCEVSDENLLRMIVGRTLGSTFPPKAKDLSKDVNLTVQSLSGGKFKDVSFDVSRGQIIGVAGVAGNGQSELMRALAGLQPSHGEVRLGGRTLKRHELLREAAFMPSDRLTEGLAGGLTIRENASMSALREIWLARNCQTQDGSRTRHGHVQVTGREGCDHRSESHIALRRQSAEGCPVARSAC